jgi:hypothetical protein
MAEQPMETDDDAGLVPPAVAESPNNSEGMEQDVQPQRSTARGPVILRDRYLVDTGAPLPELDSPTAKAFNVEDRQDLGRKLFGLVCTPELPTRTETMQFLNVDSPAGLLPLTDWDVVHWPPLGEYTMVIVFEQPIGGRVMNRLLRKEAKITEYDVPRRLVEPLLSTLQTLSDSSEPHRAIRADNLFFMDDDMTELVLGEHVTSPHGFDQPILYESIERAMALPEGRGIGNVKDDIFALGVTIGVIVLGRDPLAKMKDDEQIRLRLDQGSYTTIFGNERVPIPLMEPLRGMINDDTESRWGISELSAWLSGQRAGQTKKTNLGKAESPFTFRGKEYLSSRILALEFCNHVPDAAKAIREETFAAWVRRSLGEKDKSETITGVVQSAAFHKDGYQGTDDYLVTKVAAILDPTAPIRYRGFNFMPDGYGPFVALQAVRHNNTEIASILLSHDIPAMWFNLQSPPFPGTSVWSQTFGRLKGYLSISEPGYGIERLLYEVNPSLSCQSPFLDKSCVVAIEHLLPALNDVSNHADTQLPPVDRHIAAFIAARFDQDIHPHLKALASPKKDTSVVGMLSLLAFLQWKLRQPSMLGLASWVGGQLGPAINSYHNRITRSEIEKGIPGLVRKGSLPELFDLIDNAERRQEDRDGYAEAQSIWMAAEEEIRDIEGSGEERLTKAERKGQQSAAMMSILMAFTVVAVLFLVEAM